MAATPDSEVEVRGERARLQARAFEIFDGVFGVFDDAAQAFVRVGDVIAAVEIVVDVDFPVAIKRVDAAVEEMKFFGQFKRGDELRDYAERIAQGHGMAVEIDKHEIFPSVHANRDQTVVCAVEVADAVKLDHAFQRAIDSVGPAVVGAAKCFAQP